MCQAKKKIEEVPRKERRAPLSCIQGAEGNHGLTLADWLYHSSRILVVSEYPINNLIGYNNHNWLVVYIPLWYTYPSEKYEFVSWDNGIPNWMESHSPFMFQPPTSIIYTPIFILFIFMFQTTNQTIIVYRKPSFTKNTGAKTQSPISMIESPSGEIPLNPSATHHFHIHSPVILN